MTVPVDYLDASLGTIDLAMIRRPAKDASRRIGTMLINPGGPGASGVRRVRRGLTVSSEVAARFDIVGFDPRGIGRSHPVRCGSTVPAFRAMDLDPDTTDEAIALERAAKAVADECASGEGPLLGHLGTWETVRDVEVIRRALGESQISFLGLSYGTLIGLLWAEAYPTSVRALVLDGVVDPAQSDESTTAAYGAIDRTMAKIDAACAARADCPVTGSGGVVAAYDELARRLDDAPSSGVGPTQLAYAVFAATYGESRWPELWAALRRGLDDDLAGIAALSAWFTGLVTYAPYAIVTCLDFPHPVGFEAWQRSGDAFVAASPRFGRIAANDQLPCAFLPPATYEPHDVAAPGAPPILVIGSTGDTATPYNQAVRVATNLQSGVLLTVELDGHIALGDSDCADATITRYLVDLTTPRPGARC
ncbi:MAG: alpha/beta fold hydrolase [Acidimicrobiales bacterium]